MNVKRVDHDFLEELMELYLETLEGTEKNEWYATKREVAHAILLPGSFYDSGVVSFLEWLKYRDSSSRSEKVR